MRSASNSCQRTRSCRSHTSNAIQRGTATSRRSRLAKRVVASAAMHAERRVSFANPSKENLIGLVAGGSKKLVILCHGYTDHKNAFHFRPIADALADAGYSSLRFDFSGNGESEGTFEFGNYSKEVEDIRSAVEYARQELHCTVVGLVGHSKGGNDVLLYAAKYDDIPIVVNIAGRFDMRRGIAERFGQAALDEVMQVGSKEMTRRTPDGPVTWTLTKKSYEERLSTDMDAAAKAIQQSQIVTIHGSEDRTIPVEDAHEYDARIENHQLHVVAGADHNFRNAVHAAELVALITKTFKEAGGGLG